MIGKKNNWKKEGREGGRKRGGTKRGKSLKIEEVKVYIIWCRENFNK